MTKASITFHANERIKERATLTNNDILELLKKDLYTPLGFDKKKKNVVHNLIYHFEKDSFYVICQDFNNQEIITILHGKELRNWFVDLSTYYELKAKVINSNFEEGKQLKLLTSDIVQLNNSDIYSKYPLIKSFLISKNVSLKLSNEEKLEKQKKLDDKKSDKLNKLKKIGKENICIAKKNKGHSVNYTPLSPNVLRIKEIIEKNENFSFVSEEEDYLMISVDGIANSESGCENLRVALNKGNTIKVEKSSTLIVYHDKNEINLLLDYYCENIDRHMSSKKDAEKFLNHHGYRGLNKRRLAENIYHLYLNR